jgi:hypothetical protein
VVAKYLPGRAQGQTQAQAQAPADVGATSTVRR